MKKLLLMAAMVLSSLCMSAADGITAKVSGTNLNIGLENETSFIAFQMDITLPEGVNASEIAKTGRLADGGQVTIDGEEMATTPFIIASNVLTGNVLRVIAYNLSNSPINEASGDILNITLSAAPAQSSDIKVSNIKFVKASDLAEVDLTAVEGENGAILGDVNGDGVVDIYDVAGVLTIMKGGSTTGLNVNAANVNGDDVVDIYDVAGILSIMKSSK